MNGEAADKPRGELIAAFSTDPHEQLTYARVRTVSAVIALAAAIAALFGSLPVPALLVALLGVVVSLAWFAQGRRVARSAKQGRVEWLRVYRGGLAFDLGERAHWIPWSNVATVAVDEERLDIVLTHLDGSVVRLEPRYPGVDLYDLVRTLDDARLAAHALGEGKKGASPSA